MQTSHHALEVFEIPIGEIQEMIRRWLADTGFKVASSSPERSIHARRGSAMGLTDEQTGRGMEVILRQAGDKTAVSVFYHTSGLGPLVGATFGDILRDEVNGLFAHLGMMIAESH
jgi:hypothetical protein